MQSLIRAALSGGGRTGAQRLENVGAHAGQSRRDAAEQAGERDHSEGGKEHGPADGDVIEARQRAGQVDRGGAHQGHREESTCCAADGAEQEALGQQLPHYDAPGCAEGETKPEFVGAASGAYKKQVGEVHAGDQEDEGDGAHQHVQQGTGVADGFVFQGPEIAVHVEVGDAGIAGLDDSHDSIDIDLGLGSVDAGFQAGDEAVVVVLAFGVLFNRGEAHGNPEVVMAQPAGLEWKLEGLRHDANDGVGAAVEVDLLAEDVGVGLEALPPEGGADYRYRGGVFVLLLGEGAAEDGVDSEDGKKRGGHAFGGGVKGGSGAGNVVAGADVAAGSGKGLAFTLEDEDVGGGDAEVVRVFGDEFMHADEAAGIGEGQRAQQDGLHDREDRGRGADSHGKGEDRGCGEGRRLAQLAQAVAQVHCCGFEKGKAALAAVGFLCLGDAAEAAQGCSAGLTAGQAAPHVLFDGQVEMGAQLFVQVGVEALAAKVRCEAA